MSSEEQQDQPDEVDKRILELLGHRFGDGLVYLRDRNERRLFRQAVRMGLVSPEGYVTPRGLSLVARHGDD